MAYEVLYMQTGETPARLDRWWIDRIFTEGVSDVGAGELLVTQRATSANLSVDVAAGEAIIDGDDIADQGAYLARSTSTVNLELSAPPASDSRIDLIVFRVLDSTATGSGDATTDGVVLEVVEGTAAAPPVAPAVPASAIPLAEVIVAAGAMEILDAGITDRRAQLNAETLKVGTQAEPMTTAERDALAGADLYEGRLIDNTTTGMLQMRVGAAWVDVGPTPPGAQSATGSYTGDGTTDRTIALPFTPAYVYLTHETRTSVYFSSVGTAGNNGVRLSDTTLTISTANKDRPKPTANGFLVSGSAQRDTNESTFTFRYVAIA